MYGGYSWPIMGVDGFVMNTITLLHGTPGIMERTCCILQIVILLLHPHIQLQKLLGDRGGFSNQVTNYDFSYYGQS
jgi:hypothetical protein